MLDKANIFFYLNSLIKMHQPPQFGLVSTCCEEKIKARVRITYGDFGSGAGTDHQRCAGLFVCSSQSCSSLLAVGFRIIPNLRNFSEPSKEGDMT